MSKEMPDDLGQSRAGEIPTAASRLERTDDEKAAQRQVRKRKVSLRKLQSYGDQPRERHAAEAVRELRESIFAIGLQQPPAVRELPDGRFEILDGHRRVKACQLLAMDGRGPDKIHVLLYDMNDAEAAYYVAAEIGHSRDADPVHKATLIGRAIQHRAEQLGREPTARDMEAVVDWKRSAINMYRAIFQTMQDPRIKELVQQLDKPSLRTLYTVLNQETASDRERLLRVYVTEGAAAVREAMADEDDGDGDREGTNPETDPPSSVTERITIDNGYEYRVRITDDLTAEAAAEALGDAEQVLDHLRRIAQEEEQSE